MNTRKLDPGGIVRVQDVGTNAPSAEFGRPDFDKRDYAEFVGNGSALAAGHRSVALEAGNDDASVTNVSLAIQTKGGGGLILPKIPTASLPAASAALNATLVYDTTDHKVKVCANGSWVVVGAQTT